MGGWDVWGLEEKEAYVIRFKLLVVNVVLFK